METGGAALAMFRMQKYKFMFNNTILIIKINSFNYNKQGDEALLKCQPIHTRLPMSKISTPSVSASSHTPTSMPAKRNAPRAATLARLRQFARAYTVPVDGFAGVVLN